MQKPIKEMNTDELFAYLKNELEQATENIKSAEYGIALARMAADRLGDMIKEFERYKDLVEINIGDTNG